MGSTNTLIHPSFLSKMVFNNPVQLEHQGLLKIYKQPIKDHVYCMTVDVSEGLGLDSSAFTIIDCSVMPYEVVATYKDSNITELMFPTLLDNVGKYYNNASILVEINVGSQVVNILQQDLEYDNIVTTKTSGRRGTVIGAFGGQQSRMGIKTSKVTKRIGCSNLKSIVENNKIILNDYDLINGSSYYAEEGHHDDLVMCLVLFAWMVSQNYFKDVSNSDIRKRIMDDISDNFTPFGFIDMGMDTEEDPKRILSDGELNHFLLN